MTDLIISFVLGTRNRHCTTEILYRLQHFVNYCSFGTSLKLLHDFHIGYFKYKVQEDLNCAHQIITKSEFIQCGSIKRNQLNLEKRLETCVGTFSWAFSSVKLFIQGVSCNSDQ